MSDPLRQAFRDAAATAAAAQGVTPPAARLTPVYKRTLPYGAKRHIVEGLGCIATQSVGSTAYTTGYRVYLHREGEAESVSGSVTISLNLGEDDALVWVLQPLASWCVDKFSEAELRAMLAVVEGLKHTDEADYMFHVHGCIEPACIAYERKIKEHEAGIAQMIELLQDPAEPKTIFVPKEEAPDGKAYHRPREAGNPRDDAAHAERRLWWRTNLQRQRDKLETLSTGPDLLRYERLKRMMAAISRWSGADQRWLAKDKRRKPDLIKRRLVDLLEAARQPGVGVLDEINDVDD